MTSIKKLPVLTEEQREKAHAGTRRFNDYCTNKKQSRKVSIASLVSQAQYYGKAQGSRVTGTDPAVVSMIVAELSSARGMRYDELMIVVRHPKNNDKWIVVEGNNRHEAFLRFCKENSLDEEKAFVYVHEIEIKPELVFDDALADIGTQYNNDRAASVTNTPVINAIASGKRKMKSGTWSKHTPRSAIEHELVNVQGFAFGSESVLARVVNAILDPDHNPSNYIKLDSGQAANIVSQFDHLGSKRSQVGNEIRTLMPTNPAKDTAVSVHSLMRSAMQQAGVRKVVATVWGSHNHLTQLHIERAKMFKALYEEEVNICKYKGMTPRSIEDFYLELLDEENEEFHMEIWMISQAVDHDETSVDFGAQKAEVDGKPIYVSKLDAYEILALIEDGNKVKENKQSLKAA